MWTANAATCTPVKTVQTGKMHLVPANLTAMFTAPSRPTLPRAALGPSSANRDRSPCTSRCPAAPIFSDEGRCQPHAPLHAGFTGSAPLRLGSPGLRRGGLTSAALSRAADARGLAGAGRLSARWTRRARSFPRQHPLGIDAGAFHTDVLAVANAQVLLLHELAFAEHQALLQQLSALLGEELVAYVASERELPAAAAVAAYPFNSQLLSLPDGSMCHRRPGESRDTPAARAFPRAGGRLGRRSRRCITSTCATRWRTAAARPASPAYRAHRSGARRAARLSTTRSTRRPLVQRTIAPA